MHDVFSILHKIEICYMILHNTNTYLNTTAELKMVRYYKWTVKNKSINKTCMENVSHK